MPKTILPKAKKYYSVPKEEYELFVIWKKSQADLGLTPVEIRKIAEAPIYTPTKSELKAIERARKNFEKGDYLTLEELKDELARLG